MSTPLDEQAMMGTRPWHLHYDRGLTLCAGKGNTCHAVDQVADVAADYAGAPESHTKHLEHARFQRMRDCVNACARIPNPEGVQDGLALLWEMAEDEEHEGHAAARDALLEMGFFQDEESVADVVMGEEKEA